MKNLLQIKAQLSLQSEQRCSRESPPRFISDLFSLIRHFLAPAINFISYQVGKIALSSFIAGLKYFLNQNTCGFWQWVSGRGGGAAADNTGVALQITHTHWHRTLSQCMAESLMFDVWCQSTHSYHNLFETMIFVIPVYIVNQT